MIEIKTEKKNRFPSFFLVSQHGSVVSRLDLSGGLQPLDLLEVEAVDVFAQDVVHPRSNRLKQKLAKKLLRSIKKPCHEKFTGLF